MNPSALSVAAEAVKRDVPIAGPKPSPAQDLRFFLKSARPGFWLTSIWFYLLPVAQRPVFDSPAFWLGLFFVTFPLGILIYGWNDIMDAEIDRHNARKDTFLFGARGSDDQLRKLPRLIGFVHLPFWAVFALREGPRMIVWYAALIGATAVYNLPRVGFKNFPVLGMVNQLAYLLVFDLSSALNKAPQLPWATFFFGGLFAMHSHLLGETMDIQFDHQAGRRTTACVLGVVPSKYLLVVFLLGESLFVLRAFRETIFGVFLACGAAWFLIDALWLFRNQTYPAWLARLFLIGWNVMALGSSWYVWSTGALSGVK